MKTIRLLIIAFLCVGVASVADAKIKRHHHRHHKKGKNAPVEPTPAPTHHTVTPSLITATPGGLWSYNADLTSGQLVAGDGFTIFDFGGYVTGSIAAPADWAATTALIGSPFGTSLGLDNPTLTNLIFTYTGATINQTIGAATFTGFNASTTSLLQVIDDWVSRDHNLDGALAAQHTDQILVPGSAVPDGGSTVALLGVALAGLEGLRRVVRSRKV